MFDHGWGAGKAVKAARRRRRMGLEKMGAGGTLEGSGRFSG